GGALPDGRSLWRHVWRAPRQRPDAGGAQRRHHQLWGDSAHGHGAAYCRDRAVQPSHRRPADGPPGGSRAGARAGAATRDTRGTAAMIASATDTVVTKASATAGATPDGAASAVASGTGDLFPVTYPGPS